MSWCQVLILIESALVCPSPPHRRLIAYFIRQRELLGDLARLAYETIKELMSEAVGDQQARPGVVVVHVKVFPRVLRFSHFFQIRRTLRWNFQRYRQFVGRP